MGVKNGGQSFPLNNASIRQVNSPKNRIKGPYTSVYIDQTDRWVIVACDWDDEPCLAIRWFTGVKGNPLSSGYCIWFILPALLYAPILNTLLGSLSALYKDVTAFLNGTMTGDDLQKKYP
jgi:hypothetical protein